MTKNLRLLIILANIPSIVLGIRELIREPIGVLVAVAYVLAMLYLALSADIECVYISKERVLFGYSALEKALGEGRRVEVRTIGRTIVFIHPEALSD